MRIKRFLTLLLALSCLLSVLPVTSVNATGFSQLLEQVEAQYDAYAASIAQPNAADDGMEQLLNHALRGKHKPLNLGASAPLTACAFGSAMFREAVTQTIAYGVAALEQNQTDQVLMAFSNNWYDNNSTYRVVECDYNTTADYEDDRVRHVFVSHHKPDKPLNRNDEALILTVGSSRGRLWLDRDPADPSRYHVRVTFFDRFDFNQSLSSAMLQFNGTLGSILNILGPLMGFKSYDWYSTVEFDLTLPALCSHQNGSFRWDAPEGILTPVSENGLTERPLKVHVVPAKNGLEEALYYELESPVYLRHTDPWVMEFRYKGKTSLAISSQETCVVSQPYFLRKAKDFFAGQARTKDPNDLTASSQIRHHYGIHTAQYAAEDWHTFRIENRLSGNGSNMLWLLIDGQEVGPLDNYYIQEKSGLEVDQGTKSDWVNGIDFTIRYIGNYSYPLRGELEYFALWQNSASTAPEITDATCIQPGTRKETCSLCGLTTAQTANPLGHDPQTLPGQAPTCEETGLTESQVCARCGETVTAAQTIPALGHTPVSIPGKEPLCETEGLTEGSICSVCEKTLAPQQGITALGHSYKDGLCAICGQKDPTLLPGDANLDGKADYQDALVVLQMSIGLLPEEPIHLLLCDLDGNGHLTYSDALLILRTSIGLH